MFSGYDTSSIRFLPHNCPDVPAESHCKNPAARASQRIYSYYEAYPAVPYSAASYSPEPSLRARHLPADHCGTHIASHTHSEYKCPSPMHLPNSAFQMHRSSPPHNPEWQYLSPVYYNPRYASAILPAAASLRSSKKASPTYQSLYHFPPAVAQSASSHSYHLRSGCTPLSSGNSYYIRILH